MTLKSFFLQRNSFMIPTPRWSFNRPDAHYLQLLYGCDFENVTLFCQHYISYGVFKQIHNKLGVLFEHTSYSAIYWYVKSSDLTMT